MERLLLFLTKSSVLVNKHHYTGLNVVKIYSEGILPPIFFSGYPVACSQAGSVISGISACSIDKSNGRDGFDVVPWRRGLADSAVESLNNVSTKPYAPPGPFNAVITLRDGDMAAEKLARRWGLDHNGSRIFLEASNIDELYNDLIRICYITPFIEKILPFGLFLYNLWGRFGLGWARRKQAINISSLRD